MTFEAIYNVALDVLNKITQERGFLNPGDTVCVVSSQSGRVYNGVSHVEMINGVPTSIHAEVDAIRNMQTLGEFVVDTLVLIDAASRAPMLPCNNCIGYIMSLNPESAEGFVAMPDRLIRFSEVGMFAMGGAAAPMGAPPMGANPMGMNPSGNPMMDANPLAANPVPQSMMTSVPVSRPLPGAGAAKGDLLKNRVSSLMSIAEDDDDEDILEELGLADEGKKKKKRFGLF